MKSLYEDESAEFGFALGDVVYTSTRIITNMSEYNNSYNVYDLSLNWNDVAVFDENYSDFGVLYVEFTDTGGNVFSDSAGFKTNWEECILRA